VLAALAAYQNPDGGFGNALEPDLHRVGHPWLEGATAFWRAWATVHNLTVLRAYGLA
jgi:hypothetical protein